MKKINCLRLILLLSWITLIQSVHGVKPETRNRNPEGQLILSVENTNDVLCIQSLKNLTSCIKDYIDNLLDNGTNRWVWVRSTANGFDIYGTGKNGSQHEVVNETTCWPKEDTNGQFRLRFHNNQRGKSKMIRFFFICRDQRFAGRYFNNDYKFRSPTYYRRYNRINYNRNRTTTVDAGNDKNQSDQRVKNSNRYSSSKEGDQKVGSTIANRNYRVRDRIQVPYKFYSPGLQAPRDNDKVMSGSYYIVISAASEGNDTDVPQKPTREANKNTVVRD